MMKKHEACFHLNSIIASKRERLKRHQEELTRQDYTTYDSDTKSQRPATDKEIEWHIKHAHQEIAEVSAQIEALDIAATALTK